VHDDASVEDQVSMVFVPARTAAGFAPTETVGAGGGACTATDT
jgi:hypothetical protein